MNYTVYVRPVLAIGYVRPTRLGSSKIKPHLVTFLALSLHSLLFLFLVLFVCGLRGDAVSGFMLIIYFLLLSPLFITSRTIARHVQSRAKIGIKIKWCNFWGCFHRYNFHLSLSLSLSLSLCLDVPPCDCEESSSKFQRLWWRCWCLSGAAAPSLHITYLSQSNSSFTSRLVQPLGLLD